MPLPSNITQEHVRQAIHRFSIGHPHGFGPSSKYELVYEGRRYPPKAILGIAGEIAHGSPLTPEDFSGGEATTNAVLRKLGFVVESRASSPKSPSWTLQPGERIKRKLLHDAYGGSRQTGISPCAQTPNILIFTDPASGEQHGYFDRWDADGTFHYTGEGQRGDQQFTHGNDAILKHRKTNRALRVFRGAGGMIEYHGEFVVDSDDPYHIAEAPETGGGALRKVIVFRLQPAEPVQALAGENTVRLVPLEAHATERTVAQPRFELIEVVRRESSLVQRYAAWLQTRGVQVQRLEFSIAGGGPGREMMSDIYVPERQQLIEAKGVVTREAIRMAIGQLFDYRRFTPQGTRLAVLLPRYPGPDLEDLLKSVQVDCIWRRDETIFRDNADGGYVL
ncbi:MAG TPA: hypothetical protein VM694_17545 [Polyangium sp.]|nr:hypothetical protein [Polyangium sp.]